MVNKYVYIFLLITLPTIISCESKSFDTKESLEEHIRDVDQGFLKTTIVNGVSYSILYRPKDLLVAQELGREITSSRIDSLREKYADQSYFNLSLSKDNKELLSTVSGGREQFGALVNQLSFGMEQKVICTTTKNDTIPLLDYVYPRMYGMTKSTSMLLVFKTEDIKKGNSVKFTLKDLGFKTGDVQFTFDKDIFKNEPTIDFKGD